MRQKLLIASVVLTLTLGSILPSNAFGAMLIVYFEDYEPFSWRDEQGMMRGVLVDLLGEVLQLKMGVPVKHKGYPWLRAQEMVRFNEADAFCTVPTEARRAYTVISTEPVLVNKVSVFTWRGHPRMEAIRTAKTVADLKEFTHGQYRGSGWAQENLKGMKVFWAPGLREVLEMLAARRVDVVVESSLVMRYHIGARGLGEKVIEMPHLMDSNAFHLCIGKASIYKLHMSEFDKAMKALRETPDFEHILKRYQ